MLMMKRRRRIAYGPSSVNTIKTFKIKPRKKRNLQEMIMYAIRPINTYKRGSSKIIKLGWLPNRPKLRREAS